MPPTPRPFGLRVIIGYKLTKAPLMLALALALTLSPRSALHAAEELAQDLSGAGATLARLGAWLAAHLSPRLVVDASRVAWLDGLSTATEGLLLLRGSAWGEWVVVVLLGLLVPVEAVSLERGPSVPKLVVLVLNAAIVVYLVLRRTHRMPRPGGGVAPPR